MAAKITAVGNLVTDATTGNLPDFHSVGDVFNYAAKSATNALDVAGAGKLANAGIAGLKKPGLDLVPDAAAQLAPVIADEVADEIVTAALETSGFARKIPFDLTISASRSYVGQMAIGSLVTNPVRNAVSGQLGINIDPKDQIDISLLNKPLKRGNAPTFKADGTKVEIHHVGLNPEGPFEEMHWKKHRGIGNDKINHPNKGNKSLIPRGKFSSDRKIYWKKVFDLWK